MNRVLLFIDSLSMWMGKAFGWCIVVLTFATCYEVFMRYVLGAPTTWAFVMSIQMYGALLIMAGAYTLSRNGHVRGDMLYRYLPERGKAGIDLVLYIIFLLPGALALIWYGTQFAADSWRFKEVSWSSPARIQIYFFKTLLPLAGALVLLQGFAEICRCIVCLRTGRFPPRLHDVEETESMLIHQHENELERAQEQSGEKAR
ncbi:MAG: TRAP transporter small permease subunit [Dongiaceae bacterium]